jgi:hypothetical protein
MLSLEQLRTPKTVDEALEAIIGYLSSVGFNANGWGLRSLQRRFVRYSAIIWADLTQLIAQLVEMGFSETATGEFLTRLSESHYANSRQKATKATGYFRFMNWAVDDYVGSTNEIVTFTKDDGTQLAFIADLPGNYIGADQAAWVGMTAEKAGAEYNIPDNSKLTLATSVAGLEVTNPPAVPMGCESWIISPGTDDESDESLRYRNRNKWANMSLEKPKDAIESIVRTACPQVTRIEIADPTVVAGSLIVSVYVAGEAALSESNRLDVFNAIKSRILDPSGLTVTIAPTQSIDLRGSVYFDPAFSWALVKAAVEKAMVDFISAAPLGGYDYSPGPSHVIRMSDLETVAKEVMISGKRPVRTVSFVDTSGAPAADANISDYAAVVRGNWNSLTYLATAK